MEAKQSLKRMKLQDSKTNSCNLESKQKKNMQKNNKNKPNIGASTFCIELRLEFKEKNESIFEIKRKTVEMLRITRKTSFL